MELLGTKVETTKDDKLFINYPLLLLFVGLIWLHLAGLSNGILNIVVSIVETLISFIFLFKGDVKKSLLFTAAFSASSYDSGFFALSSSAGIVYSIDILPILQGHHITLYVLILLIITWNRIKKESYLNYTPITRFAKFTVIAGFLMAVVSVLINGFYYPAFAKDVPQVFIPASMIIIFSYYLSEDEKFSKCFEMIIFHLFLAMIVMGWYTILTHRFATIEDLFRTGNALLLPTASFYMFSILIFLPFLKSKLDKIVVMVLSGSAVYFQLYFDSVMNGKSWFVIATTIILFLYLIVVKKGKNNILKKITTIIAVVVLLLQVVPFVESYTQNTENKKLLDFMTVFDAGKTGDIDDMGASSVWRGLEFVNIMNQYGQQPVFAPFGRGYGGFIHNNGMFPYADSTFSVDQYKNDKFYRMHESINVIFLKFGFVGLFFLIYILFTMISKVKYSPWLYIGSIWLLFFFGYLQNLAYIGIPSMIIGYNYYLKANRLNKLKTKESDIKKHPSCAN